MNLKAFFLVGIGGAAGSILRYATGIFIGKAFTGAFPLATFSINIIGSLIIGLLFGLSLRNTNGLQQDGMLILATGFCGGFTTFSTFALENVNLFQKGQSSMALVYSGLSVVVGLLLCRVGIWLTA